MPLSNGEDFFEFPVPFLSDPSSKSPKSGTSRPPNAFGLLKGIARKSSNNNLKIIYLPYGVDGLLLEFCFFTIINLIFFVINLLFCEKVSPADFVTVNFFNFSNSFISG